LITSVLQGFNVCIFAYGQTGAGKTFTMEGTSSNPGVNTRTLAELFRVADERKAEFSTEISVSILEIYNEHIRDLLISGQTKSTTEQKYEVKQGADGMYVPNLTSLTVKTLEDVQRIITLGSKNRAVGTTNMNEYSSRSHSLLVVKVACVNLLTEERIFGKLTLVDLAGSERVDKSGVTEDRLKEAQAINKSLSALGNVIAALQLKEKHIPYRNSKLTYLLQDSLGGNSKTLMFVQVSPSSNNTMETINSLVFASRVRSVELGQAKRNISSPVGDKEKEKDPFKPTIKQLEAEQEAKKYLKPITRMRKNSS